MNIFEKVRKSFICQFNFSEAARNFSQENTCARVKACNFIK